VGKEAIVEVKDHFVRACSLALILAISLILIPSAALADDAFVTTDIAGVGSGFAVQAQHEDADPFKGTLTLNVTNTGTAAWGGMHFQVYQVFEPIPNFAFMPVPAPQKDSVDLSTFLIAPDDKSIDLFFYSSPVNAGASTTLTVYTDNQDQASFFGVMFYPLPVPEPTMFIVLLAAVPFALIRRTHRA
jgi:hypothetical protein